METRALMQILMPERPRFVGLARSRVGSEADAVDIVQRALARAADRAATLDDPLKARAWFYRLLRRAIVDHVRVGGGDPLRLQTETDLDSLPDTRPHETDAVCACAAGLLDDVRPAYQEVVRRVDVNGEVPDVVAVDLGITIENLHVRLHRARRVLKRDVQHCCGVSSLRPCLDCTCDTGQRCGAPVI